MHQLTAPAEPALRRNFLWALAANFASGASGWGMYVVLAKLGTPEMIGQYALGMAIAMPLALLADLHLRATLGTDAGRQFPFRDYLGLRCLTLLGLLAAVPLITAAAGYPWETAWVIVAVGVARALESLIELYYGLLQRHERMDRVARSLLLRGPLSLVLLAAALVDTHSLIWGLVALVTARALVLVCHDVPSSARVAREPGVPRWHGPTLRRLAGLTLPIAFVMMLIALNASIPVLFVERVCGEHELGIFAALFSLTSAGALVATAAGQAVGPRLAVRYTAGDLAGFRALLRNTILLGLLLGAAGVGAVLLVGRPILRLVYAPEYAERADLLAWLTVGVVVEYATSLLGWGITATRKFRRYPLPYLITTASAVVAAAVLVPRFGLTGAAWAVCVVNVVSFGVLLAVLAATLADPPAAIPSAAPGTSPAAAGTATASSWPPG